MAKKRMIANGKTDTMRHEFYNTIKGLSVEDLTEKLTENRQDRERTTERIARLSRELTGARVLLSTQELQRGVINTALDLRR